MSVCPYVTLIKSVADEKVNFKIKLIWKKNLYVCHTNQIIRRWKSEFQNEINFFRKVYSCVKKWIHVKKVNLCAKKWIHVYKSEFMCTKVNFDEFTFLQMNLLLYSWIHVYKSEFQWIYFLQMNSLFYSWIHFLLMNSLLNTWIHFCTQ